MNRPRGIEVTWGAASREPVGYRAPRVGTPSRDVVIAPRSTTVLTAALWAAAALLYVGASIAVIVGLGLGGPGVVGAVLSMVLFGGLARVRRTQTLATKGLRIAVEGDTLSVQSVVRSEYDTSEVQSMHVVRRTKAAEHRKPGEPLFNDYFAPPLASTSYELLARIAGRLVRLASFRTAREALFVQGELSEALGLEADDARRRIVPSEVVPARVRAASDDAPEDEAAAIEARADEEAEATMEQEEQDLAAPGSRSL